MELEYKIWFPLSDLGLVPGMSVYYLGVKVTKTKGFGGLCLAAKWKRNYKGLSSKEPWFILTNLESLSLATSAYAKRMGIEEMFRDLKLGGYNLESTQLSSQRLISLILLITLAYSCATIAGQNIKSKGVAKYVTRPSESKRRYPRHSGATQGRVSRPLESAPSSFSTGQHGHNWLENLTFFDDVIQELLCFSLHKLPYYLKGKSAAELIHSAL
ncbi:hypothetical protein [Moorena sp. SIO4G3]|uniref:hypothetical protein n=1 Tax=Moorena sp. SIO4G3 TaxID=2607821 RepID=UPI0025F3FD43|nr:hypothetical protein [Moorena sp. SIO4G3]